MFKMSTGCYAAIIIFLASLTGFCNCYDVIIIGAGASGIAAGLFLLNNGIENFVILEAEDRIGGRINSIKFGESFVDLGAEWCLGKKNNMVYSIAKDSQLTMRVVDENYTFSYSEDYPFLDYSESDLKKLRRKFSNVFFKVNSSNINATLSDAFYQYVHDTLYEMGFMFGEEFFKSHRHRFQGLKSIALSHESFFAWDDIPSKNHHRKCNGWLRDFNGEGFSKILQTMMNESPYSKEKDRLHTKIIYNSEIEKIIWREHNNAGITLRNTKGDIYHSKYVIFTPSLGVLKEKHSSLFEPGLPQSKIDAIDCLGFEGVIKVFLQWNTAWWGENFPPTLLLWDDDRIKSLKNNRTSFLNENDTDPWVLSLTQILPSPNNPNVLAAWFTGNMSKEIEKLSDDELVDGIMFVLDKFFSDETLIIEILRKPRIILRSSWNSNPHFLGSHSFETMKSTSFPGSCNKEMSNPLYRNGKPVVLFAGEATSTDHYSTVHGAIESGEREGERVISAYSVISEQSVM